MDKIFSFQHQLSTHPLLQLEELRSLAKRHNLIRFHSAKINRAQNLDTVKEDCSNGLTLEETLNQIEHTGSAVVIREVERDPLYKPLVEEMFKSIKLFNKKAGISMYNCHAWIFITSPEGITPYHRDQEHTHFFHVRGEKTVWLWDHTNRSLITQEEDEFFHGVNKLTKTIYRDSLMKHAHEFKVVPNEGLYFPPTAPHMVENGNEYSISMTLTYMSNMNMRVRRIHKINQIIRKLGFEPTDVNKSRLKDEMKLILHFVFRSFLAPVDKNWKNL